MEIKKQEKWYFKTSVFIIAILSVGPLALPLLWFNPRFSWKGKIIISAVVIILSYYLGILLANSLKSLSSYYQFLKQTL